MVLPFFAKFFIFLNLIYKSVGFPLQSHSIRLEGFLPSAVYQTIFFITRFFLLSSHWVRRILSSTNILWSIPQLFYRAKRFFTSNKLLVFFSILPFGLRGFLPSTSSHIYKFDRVHANKKGNCNIPVIRPLITRPSVTWSINCSLCYNLSISSYAHTLYQINTSFLEQKSPMRLKSTSLLGDYLQINTFFILVLVEQKL